MSASRNAYVAADGQTDFDVSFPYIEPAHVEVQVNGSPAEYQWLNSTRVRVSGVQSGDAVRLLRRTPVDVALVTFQNGSTLTEEELNKAVRQTLYIQQELIDDYGEALTDAKVRLGDNLGIVTDPQALMDQLVQDLLNNSLINDLRERLSEIERVSEGVLEQAMLVNRINIDMGAQILQESTTRASEVEALASTLSLLGARTADGTAFVLDLLTAKVSPTESLAQRLEAISAGSLAGIEASIAEEQTARSSADEALASDITQLKTRTTNAEAAITAEATARSSGDTALAQTLSLLGAKNGAGTAFVLDQSTVQVEPGTSLGQRLSGIDVAASQNQAAIATEQTARVQGDSANAQSITALQARVGTAESNISSVQSVTQSQAQSISALVTKTNGHESYIATLQQTTADQAASIQSITSTVNGNSANITSLQQVTNGLNAKVGLTLNVSGHVTGWSMNNNGQSGSFVVAADRFAIVSPNGGDAVVPFEVVDGVVRAPNMEVERLKVGSIQTDHLVDGAVSSAYSASASGTTPSEPPGAFWGTPVVGPTVAVAATGRKLLLMLDINYNGTGPSEDSVWLRHEILRDGVVIKTTYSGAATMYDGSSAWPYHSQGGSTFLMDQPTAGNHTYSVRSSQWRNGPGFHPTVEASLYIQELKR